MPAVSAAYPLGACFSLLALGLEDAVAEVFAGIRTARGAVKRIDQLPPQVPLPPSCDVSSSSSAVSPASAALISAMTHLPQLCRRMCSRLVSSAPLLAPERA